MKERLVCNGVKAIYAEARAEEREIFEKKIYAFVEKKKLLPADAAEALEISIDQLKENMSKAGYNP